MIMYAMANLYFILNIVTGTFCLSLFILLLVFRGPDIFKPAARLMFLFWFWLLMEELEHFSPLPEKKVLFNSLKYLSPAFLPVVWIAFCYQIRYDRSFFVHKASWLTLIFPVAVVLLVFTNPMHQLLWINNGLTINELHVDKELTFLFDLLILIIFMFIATGLLLIVIRPKNIKNNSGYWRWVVVAMGVLSFMTVIAEWLTKYTIYYDLTPVSLTLVALSMLFYLSKSIKTQILLNKSDIMSAIKEPLLLVNEDGLILFANNTACALSGINNNDFYTTYIKDAIPPLESIHEGVIFYEHLFFTVNINSLSREKDKVLIISLTEITALKDSEISLKHLTDELENQVKSRTEKLNESNMNLERLLEEKNILLQEVHHRVNNNLQLIISLLNLQGRRAEEPILQENLKDAVSRVQTIAMVHQMLYKSEDFTRINLKTYLNDLVKSILFDPGYVLDLDFDDIICSTSACIQIGMIMNEIILNALKYAYGIDDEQKVFRARSWLEKKKDGDDSLHILFRDYGKGIDNSILEQSESGSSLGFRIIKTLIQQRQGDYRIYNDGGCVYELNLEL